MKLEENSPITALKGIGEKTELLYRRLGIETLGQLIAYYPRNYETYEDPVSIEESAVRDHAAIQARIRSVPSVRMVKKLAIVSTVIEDASGEKLRVTWYQMSYLRNTLKPGMVFVFRGSLKGFGASRFLEQPAMYSLGKYEELQKTLQPVYPLTAGLTNPAISKAIRQALDGMPQPAETLPEKLLQRYQLMPYARALQLVHFPENREAFVQARRRMVFEEFYRFLLGIRGMRAQLEQEKNHFAITPREEMKYLIANLPYSLTGAQLRTWKEISADLCGHHIMNRLVQGDVGSGKTIVAFLAMIQTALCGYQAALMAPTEVLAAQHYEALTRLIMAQGLGLHAVLLTGSVSAAQKRYLYEEIAEGRADFVIGTHALIQDRVQYRDLALVITDEQHRFGVRQREKLKEKGRTPHVLVMSATPIPRTLAIILYGDLDISVMDELPASRLPIKNCTVDIRYRPKAWRFLQKQVEEGHQAYVICPMVEESENMEGEDVISYTKRLREELPSVSVEYLHGRMKNEQKEEIMRRFASQKIQILVSTTVIEVGIDVPNATVILIENAERFGLAQLHQLRGRVGRGKWQSYCIMMNTSGTEEAKQRLEILNHSNDGFWIAAEDLKLRGPGDFFGIRQSGAMSFQLADPYTDSEILKQAAEAVGAWNDSSEGCVSPDIIDTVH